MSTTKYLITGATGATGSEAVLALLEAGQDVRALAHREDERSQRLQKQGAEVVFGDLTDFASVKAALQGVNRAYFNFPVAPGLVQATTQFAQVAKEVGVEAIVNMSQKIARADATSPAAFQHWLAERVFDWSGIPVTHLRPTFFAEWLFTLAPMIKLGTVYAPYGAGKTAMIAAEDIARVVVNVLQKPEAHSGQTYDLYGTTERTFAEVSALTGHVLGKEVHYQQVPFEALFQALSAGREGVARNDALSAYAESNIPDASGESHLSLHLRRAADDLENGLFSGTNNYTVERITGRSPMTVEEFVAKHRTTFV